MAPDRRRARQVGGESGRFREQFFVIVDGIAQVIRDGKHVAYLGPGDFFGEMALLADTAHGASVIAVSPLKLLKMPERAFRRARRAQRSARTEEGV